MRSGKQSDSPSGYSRDVYPLRASHGLNISDVQHSQAHRLTELNNRSVRLGGAAVSLMDPRDIAGEILLRARNVHASVLGGGEMSASLADDLGAQLLALRLALARSEHDRIETGGEAA